MTELIETKRIGGYKYKLEREPLGESGLRERWIILQGDKVLCTISTEEEALELWRHPDRLKKTLIDSKRIGRYTYRLYKDPIGERTSWLIMGADMVLERVFNEEEALELWEEPDRKARLEKEDRAKAMREYEAKEKEKARKYRSWATREEEE